MGITRASSSAEVIRLRICQCQSFHWSSGTSRQIERRLGSRLPALWVCLVGRSGIVMDWTFRLVVNAGNWIGSAPVGSRRIRIDRECLKFHRVHKLLAEENLRSNGQRRPSIEIGSVLGPGGRLRRDSRYASVSSGVASSGPVVRIGPASTSPASINATIRCSDDRIWVCSQSGKPAKAAVKCSWRSGGAPASASPRCRRRRHHDLASSSVLRSRSTMSLRLEAVENSGDGRLAQVDRSCQLAHRPAATSANSSLRTTNCGPVSP